MLFLRAISDVERQKVPEGWGIMTKELEKRLCDI